MIRQFLNVALPTILLIFLAACGSSCPPDKVTYLDPPYPSGKLNAPGNNKLMETKGKEILFDDIITGPVCNDTWSGMVYVTCDIQIPSWEKDPFFFEDCGLEIDQDAVIYVEAHRDKAYNEGCSCHE